jgi:hypothetical protein
MPGEEPGSPLRAVWAKSANSGGLIKNSSHLTPTTHVDTGYLCDTYEDNDLAEYQCVAKIMSGYHNKNNIAIRSQNIY